MLVKRKKLFASLLIFLSLAIISWFILFEYSVRWLEKGIEEFTSNLRHKGYIVSYSKVVIAGNPFLLTVTFQNPHMKDPKGRFDWQGQEMVIVIQPWQPFTFTSTFPGDQKLIVPQNTPIPLGVLKFEGAEGIFSLTSRGTLEEVNFTIDSISSFMGDQPQPVSLGDTSLNIKNLINPLNLSFLLTTHVVNLEKTLGLPPRDAPFTVDLEATLSGYQSKYAMPKSLAEWRDGGGVLEVGLLKFTWPPLMLEANGTLTLDRNMYPLGAFSSKVIGYQDALADIVKLGWVKKKNAAGISFILGLFSVQDEGGGKHLPVPITIQNKALSVGPAKLFKLRPLEGF
ncbi:MAG: hypothetical protein BGO67_08045 [Alphaproteobacteria bacterium 41-28]|mgnify:CR=1 FL=1|nr:MAG: hypothetical protein BGO67_08045 [Alphaproteobacteria bacterium 41-28]